MAVCNSGTVRTADPGPRGTTACTAGNPPAPPAQPAPKRQGLGLSGTRSHRETPHRETPRLWGPAAPARTLGRLLSPPEQSVQGHSRDLGRTLFAAPGRDFICSTKSARRRDAGTSGLRQPLLDEVGDQLLRPLLVLHQQLVGAADLVPLQAVEQGDAHHSRCGEQRPSQRRVPGSSLSPLDGDEAPTVPSRRGAGGDRSNGPALPLRPPSPAQPSPARSLFSVPLLPRGPGTSQSQPRACTALTGK